MNITPTFTDLAKEFLSDRQIKIFENPLKFADKIKHIVDEKGEVRIFKDFATGEYHIEGVE
jgi:hypothetical protein